MKFGLTPSQFSELENLVIRPLKALNAKVWLFGSRATGQHRQFSDVDLLFEAEPPIELAQIARIRETIENSNFPYKVDLVNISELAESYRERVLTERMSC